MVLGNIEMPSLENGSAELADDVFWFLKLQAFVASALSSGLDVSDALNLPEIDQKINEFLESSRKSEDSAGRDNPNGKIVLIKLRKASDLAKNIFQIIEIAVQNAKTEKRLLALGFVTVSAGIGAIKAVGGAVIAAKTAAGAAAATTVTAAATGTTAAAAGTTAAAAGTTAAATGATAIATAAVAGAATGAVIGAILVIVPLAIYENRIDFEAKMRYLTLKSELIQIRSTAEELQVYHDGPKVSQLIEELENLINKNV